MDQLLHPGGKDLAQPAHQFPLAASQELGELVMRLQEGLLDQIGGIYFSLQAPADLQPGQQLQIAVVKLQELAESRTTARASAAQKLLRVQTGLAAHGYDPLSN